MSRVFTMSAPLSTNTLKTVIFRFPPLLNRSFSQASSLLYYLHHTLTVLERLE